MSLRTAIAWIAWGEKVVRKSPAAVRSGSTRSTPPMTASSGSMLKYAFSPADDGIVEQQLVSFPFGGAAREARRFADLIGKPSTAAR